MNKEEFLKEYATVHNAPKELVDRAIYYGFQPKRESPNISLDREETTLFEIKDWLRYEKCLFIAIGKDDENLEYDGTILYQHNKYKFYATTNCGTYPLGIDLPICKSYEEVQILGIKTIFDEIFER